VAAVASLGACARPTRTPSQPALMLSHGDEPSLNGFSEPAEGNIKQSVKDDEIIGPLPGVRARRPSASALLEAKHALFEAKAAAVQKLITMPVKRVGGVSPAEVPTKRDSPQKRSGSKSARSEPRPRSSSGQRLRSPRRFSLVLPSGPPDLVGNPSSPLIRVGHGALAVAAEEWGETQDEAEDEVDMMT
ncbi:unnamed protein product, partial [Polarella glacialis]